MLPIDPTYPALARGYEAATGLPYPAGLAVLTDLLFDKRGGGDADER